MSAAERDVRATETDYIAQCVHDLLVGLPDTSDPRECQSCDWCPVCSAVQSWTSEVCDGCGRVWGACETCNTDPCGCS